MKFIELFGGVGGFRLGLESAGHECVWYNEIDKYCVKVYNHNFGENYEPKEQQFERRLDNISNTLTSVTKDNYIVHSKNYIQLDISGKGHNSQQDRIYKSDKVGPTICGSSKDMMILDDYELRNITPIECERLQGFPDDWTKVVSDTQRYKQMGNAVTVNVIKAIAERF